ncbi:hypothetical protein AVEN_105026-1 [Araneus ventricosus]|uniref:Uncharacterized protein n=1 Tax=Araneus ventricosus TaxID=182803 RepID=A0A4Y2GFP9_ARAVE|nr:hypothetical protein AVEN_105026-1 [Araneus ventricosus]
MVRKVTTSKVKFEPAQGGTGSLLGRRPPMRADSSWSSFNGRAEPHFHAQVEKNLLFRIQSIQRGNTVTFVAKSWLRDRRGLGSKPDPRVPSRMWAWCTSNLTSRAVRPPVGMVGPLVWCPQPTETPIGFRAHRDGRVLVWCGHFQKRFLPQVRSSSSGQGSKTGSDIKQALCCFKTVR